MTKKRVSQELYRARRALNNFRAMVRRPSNWQGALEGGYASAYKAVLQLEDADGVEAAGPLNDRLTALRQESGLSPDEVIRAEQWAMGRTS